MRQTKKNQRRRFRNRCGRARAEVIAPTASISAPTVRPDWSPSAGSSINCTASNRKMPEPKPGKKASMSIDEVALHHLADFEEAVAVGVQPRIEERQRGRRGTNGHERVFHVGTDLEDVQVMAGRPRVRQHVVEERQLDQPAAAQRDVGGIRRGVDVRRAESLEWVGHRRGRPRPSPAVQRVVPDDAIRKTGGPLRELDAAEQAGLERCKREPKNVAARIKRERW